MEYARTELKGTTLCKILFSNVSGLSMKPCRNEKVDPLLLLLIPPFRKSVLKHAVLEPGTRGRANSPAGFTISVFRKIKSDISTIPTQYVSVEFAEFS